MIPILYDANETNFTSAGVAVLSDAISCTVEEELNGTYELTMEYPINGRHYSMIQEEMFIGATHDDTGKLQPFKIYGRSAPINGIVEFNAHHISYKLNKIVTMPFTASSAADALTKIAANAVGENPFTFETDVAVSGSFGIEVPTEIREVLGGSEGSLLQTFGGEWEFDGFKAILHNARGEITDVAIRYGKNLVDLTHEINGSGTYNAVVPFWKDENRLLTLPEKYISFAAEGTEIKYAALDLSDEFELEDGAAPTYAQMRTKARELMQSGTPWVPEETIEVNFVQLWQTPEYERYAELQRVNLGDRVQVYYPALGVIANQQKVVKTVYDTLLNRYNEVTLNELRTTLGEMTSDKIASETNSVISESVALALTSIQGGLGGYIAIPYDAQGRPARLYVLDQPKLADAVNVLRFDQNGMMHSANGINGTYEQVTTINGKTLRETSGSVTLDANGAADISTLIPSGCSPVFAYLDNAEAYITFARTSSGGYLIRCTDAAGTALAGSYTITVHSKK